MSEGNMGGERIGETVEAFPDSENLVVRGSLEGITEHAVVIAGGGSTGLMLAGELALTGVDVALVERRASQDLTGSRAGGLSTFTHHRGSRRASARIRMRCRTRSPTTACPSDHPDKTSPAPPHAGDVPHGPRCPGSSRPVEIPSSSARDNTVVRARWARVTLFHEAEHAAYVLRKSRCTSSAVRSTGAPFREREVSG